MTPEEHFKEVVKLDMDKFDKKAPKFDYYDLLDFAESYCKNQLTLTDVSQQRELLIDFMNKTQGKLIWGWDIGGGEKLADEYLKGNLYLSSTD